MKQLFEMIETALRSNRPTEIVDAYLACYFPLLRGREIEVLTERQIISDLIYRLIGLACIEEGKLEQAHYALGRIEGVDFQVYIKLAKHLVSKDKKGIIESEV